MSIMRLAVPLSIPLLVLVLSSCALTVQGAGIDVTPMNVASADIINDRLGLRGYPGATIIRQEQEDDESRTTFETGASADSIFSHFDSQLRNRGWQRRELERKPNEVKAEYRRQGEELELKLKREGQSGRYRLELELDD